MRDGFGTPPSAGGTFPVVLIVDDDPHILELVQLYLSHEGFKVLTAHTGPAALDAVEEAQPDLVILDIMLPGLDGWQVCREIRQRSNLPILILSAKGQTSDRILGLELGADDYLAKPFEPPELVARVHAVLRRSGLQRPKSTAVTRGPLSVDLSQYVVYIHGHRVEMPPKELELLHYLASHPNQVFTREQLMEAVWGSDFLGGSRTVDVHIQRLRARLLEVCDQCALKTVWGIGYKFEVPQNAP